MIQEARIGVVRSYIPEGGRSSEPGVIDAEWFRIRDRHIAHAIRGNIGIVPITPLSMEQVTDFCEQNYLRSELEESFLGEGGSTRLVRTVLVDTRYLPDASGHDKYVLYPEIYFHDTREGIGNYSVDAEAVRGFPYGSSPAIVKTVHRLIIGMLVDGANTSDVLRVYDKAGATSGETPSVKPEEFIKALRRLSPRGGYLSYRSLSLTPVSSSQTR